MSVLFPELEPNSPEAEAYRMLRTNLNFLVDKKKIRSILVTSTGQGFEGKSTISLNLAYSMAEANKRVAVVDADFRKPRLHMMLDIEPVPGVIDILQGMANISDGIRHTGGSYDIEILPSGFRKHGTIPLINQFSFRNLLKRLEAERDLVIVDSAPLIISDTLSLAAAVDGVIIIASMGESNRRFFREGLKKLKNADANVLGIVANKIPKKQKSYYYAYY